MKRGYLSEYFAGIAMKELRAVEANPSVSHQHEINATRGIIALTGQPHGKDRIPSKFIYLSDAGSDPIVEDSTLTLYDSRENQPHRSAEYRMYFPDNEVMKRAEEGDLLVVAKRRDTGLLAIVAEGGSTIAAQLEWLFGLSGEVSPQFSVRADLEDDRDRIGFAATFVLESIGVEVAQTQDSHLDVMLERFGGAFPSTRDFSAFARETLPDVSPQDDVDGAVMAWMEWEEILFRTLEKHLMSERVSRDFKAGDIDKLASFFMSVFNRRKSRAGLALENHVEYALVQLGIRYARTPITENKSKPDFLFPGAAEYHDPDFPATSLTMLGVKSTLKDRWRQVLAEADRIEVKHLLTFEASISTSQTDEMRDRKLQLVVPERLRVSYTPLQQAWLWNVGAFIDLVRDRQAGAPGMVQPLP